MVAELRVAGGDKGRAVERLMARPPMRGTTPVFVGDDLTDEEGFRAARKLGGHGVLVGAPRSTAADYKVDSPAALRRWLAGAAK
jgi:trehalose 6-phosphate phosphatase